MRWQIIKNGSALEDLFDDGVLYAQPGDPEFTVEHVDAEVKRVKASDLNYVGCSYPEMQD